jgi:hypothetical protein
VSKSASVSAYDTCEGRIAFHNRPGVDSTMGLVDIGLEIHWRLTLLPSPHPSPSYLNPSIPNPSFPPPTPASIFHTHRERDHIDSPGADSSRGVLTCRCEGGIRVGMMSVCAPCLRVRGAHRATWLDRMRHLLRTTRCGGWGEAVVGRALPAACRVRIGAKDGEGNPLRKGGRRRGHRCLRASPAHAASVGGVHHGSRER